MMRMSRYISMQLRKHNMAKMAILRMTLQLKMMVVMVVGANPDRMTFNNTRASSKAVLVC